MYAQLGTTSIAEDLTAPAARSSAGHDTISLEDLDTHEALPQALPDTPLNGDAVASASTSKRKSARRKARKDRLVHTDEQALVVALMKAHCSLSKPMQRTIFNNLFNRELTSPFSSADINKIYQNDHKKKMQHNTGMLARSSSLERQHWLNKIQEQALKDVAPESPRIEPEESRMLAPTGMLAPKGDELSQSKVSDALSMVDVAEASP